VDFEQKIPTVHKTPAAWKGGSKDALLLRNQSKREPSPGPCPGSPPVFRIPAVPPRSQYPGPDLAEISHRVAVSLQNKAAETRQSPSFFFLQNSQLHLGKRQPKGVGLYPAQDTVLFSESEVEGLSLSAWP
jgi:hypothetical protein